MPVQSRFRLKEKCVCCRKCGAVKQVHDVIITHACTSSSRHGVCGLAFATFVIVVNQVFVHGIPSIVLEVFAGLIAGREGPKCVRVNLDAIGVHFSHKEIHPINSLGTPEYDTGGGGQHSGTRNVPEETCPSVIGLESDLLAERSTLTGKAYPPPSPTSCRIGCEDDTLLKSAHEANITFADRDRSRIRGSGTTSTIAYSGRPEELSTSPWDGECPYSWVVSGGVESGGEHVVLLLLGSDVEDASSGGPRHNAPSSATSTSIASA